MSQQERFFEEFQTYLSGAVESPNLLLITGDFNIHVNDDNNPDHIRLRDLFSMYDLVQHVHVPTHKSGNTLDLIVTRANDELLLSNPVADYMISDHMFVCTDVNIPRPPLMESNITFRKLGNIDHDDFSADLKRVVNSLMCMDDVNQLAIDYNIQLRHVLDTHAPIRTKTIVARPCVPWFDHELKALKANRRKAEHRYRCCKTQESLMKFHEARNMYVNSLNTKRTYHLSHLVSEARGNTKNLFTLVNSLCDKMKSNPLPTHDSIESLTNVFAFLETKLMPSATILVTLKILMHLLW